MTTKSEIIHRFFRNGRDWEMFGCDLSENDWLHNNFTISDSSRDDVFISALDEVRRYLREVVLSGNDCSAIAVNSMVPFLHSHHRSLNGCVSKITIYNPQVSTLFFEHCVTAQ